MAVLKNARHENYVQNLIAGMSQRQAYREAFPNSANWKDSTVDSKASVLFSGKILERYQEVQEEQKNAALLTRWEKRKLLSDIARDKEADDADRIRAIDTDNKMENAYKTELDMEEQRIRIERAKIAKAHESGEVDTGKESIRDFLKAINPSKEDLKQLFSEEEADEAKETG